jgi:hypothetical protein
MVYTMQGTTLGNIGVLGSQSEDISNANSYYVIGVSKGQCRITIQPDSTLIIALHFS